VDSPKPPIPKFNCPEALKAVYANLVRISHSPGELVFDFAQLLPGDANAEIINRVLMSPIGAKLFYHALGDNLQRYDSWPVHYLRGSIHPRNLPVNELMNTLPTIIDKINKTLEACTSARDQALVHARAITRHSANAIRATHRGEVDLAEEHIAETRKLAGELKSNLVEFPDLYFAGYTQDALKEYCEASLTFAIIENKPLPDPDSLGVEHATYLNGLAETVGELRRRCLDILRQGYSHEAERLLGCMDDIYSSLITMDYPDAVTNGLRRQTDLVRGIVERTRGDLTISLREQHLESTMLKLAEQLNKLHSTK
jgi:translin